MSQRVLFSPSERNDQSTILRTGDVRQVRSGIDVPYVVQCVWGFDSPMC
jgi:hypothetical protein